MFPETLVGGAVLLPTDQSQFVGPEHETPLGISDRRPMTHLVQHRGIRGQGRIPGSGKGSIAVMTRRYRPAPNTAIAQS